MTPDWREAAEAAEKFFALVGDTVDQRIARIATNARAASVPGGRPLSVNRPE